MTSNTNAKGQLLLPAPGESSYGKTTGDDGSSLGLVSGGVMKMAVGVKTPMALNFYFEKEKENYGKNSI